MRKSFSSRLVAWFLMLSLLVSCWGKEPIDPTPPTPPTPTVDTKAPVISVSLSSVNVIGGQDVTLGTSELKIGDKAVATWKDDVSKTCKAGLELDGKAISSGTKLSDPGKLKLTVTDEAGNSSSAEITLTKTDSQAPEIEVKIPEKNVIAGVKVKIEGNQLLFDSEVAATWKDDYSETYNVELSIAGKKINSGDILFDAGTLFISVTDEFQNKATADITLKAVAVYWLENLQGKTLQVDQEVNLLEGLTFAEGLTLQKVEVEQDGARSEIAHPEAYSPQIPGAISIILTLSRTDGSTIEVKVDNLSVQGIQYQAMKITDLKPVEILPIIGQIVAGDKKVYDHIEHLRIAEATRIRDMMWEYGAGAHSSTEYQVLMGRLYAGMALETPGYDNFEVIGTAYYTTPSYHATTLWSILDELLNKARLFICNPVSGSGSWFNLILEHSDNHPNCIYVVWTAVGNSITDRDYYLNVGSSILSHGLTTLLESRKFVLFQAGTNVQNSATGVLNRIVNEEYDLDVHWVYSIPLSFTNSDKNTHPERHVMVTIATNKTGNLDQTGVSIESSKFPIGFADNVLFSGRGFPEFAEGVIYWPSGRYTTSETTYTNVALCSLCFQMFAEAIDIDQLLDMIRATCLTDYIHLDLNEDGDTNDIIDGHPETVPLQLINPGGFFKKYCMPSSTPASIGTNGTINFEKGYYKGVIFDIPGAEVKIGDEWMPFTAENAIRIKAANPMNLEWRINGSLLRKYGYTPGQTLQGQIITVDDQWNGLRLEKDFTIQIN